MATGKNAPFGLAIWDMIIRATLYAVKTAPTINVSAQDAVLHGGAHLDTTKGGYLPIIEDGSVPDGNAAILGTVIAVFDENMDPIDGKYIVAGAVGDGVVAGFVMVSDSPDQLYVVQEDSDGNSIELSEGGQNVDIVSATLAAPNTTTGISTMELDSDTAGTSAALQCKLMRPHPKDTAAEAYCRYIVQLNEHYYGDTIAGL